MRIAFACYWFLLDRRDGVVRKIEAQTSRWREAGHEVEVFCVARRRPGRQHDPPDWNIVFFDGALPGRIRATAKLVDAVRAWRPDALYARYDLYLPPFPRLVRSLPSVFEINADDKEEAKLRFERPFVARAYNELNRRALLSRADAFVCVTNELARSPSFTPFRKPTKVIANGVDLSLVRELPPARSERPTLAFLGSMRQKWHGIDKIVELARLLSDFDVEVVGFERDRFEVAGPVPDNLHLRGVLAREEYEPILERSDAAIGTLALHRKNMQEACPLKVREYLGYGLPVVLAYDDTDFMDIDPWYLLRLPNEESNVREHAGRIRSFVESVRGRRVPRADVADRVGVDSKEAARVAFIGEVVSVVRRRR